jgi:hypothetical protein
LLSFKFAHSQGLLNGALVLFVLNLNLKWLVDKSVFLLVVWGNHINPRLLVVCRRLVVCVFVHLNLAHLVLDRDLHVFEWLLGGEDVLQLLNAHPQVHL